MAFEPVARRPVSEVVFEDLRRAVLTGAVSAGEALPPERVLAERFAVNRHAVREALKRLQQSGLVEVHHGGATRVLDWRTTGGLDLLAHMPYAGEDAAGPDVLRSVLEARLTIGVDVARLAAGRASEAALAGLRARAAGGAELGEDLGALSVRYEELWRALVAASGNLAYVLAYNSLLAAGNAAGTPAHEIFAAESRDLAAHADLVEAVAARDADGAAARAAALLSRSLVHAPEPCTT
jgi:DNA-binding FadR family transcriptional regulator